jgi:excisionase family DNA binding protein
MVPSLATTQTQAPIQPHRQLYSVKEFGAIYGLGSTSIYALLKSGALRAVKVRGLTKIRRDDAEAWANSLSPRAA